MDIIKLIPPDPNVQKAVLFVPTKPHLEIITPAVTFEKKRKPKRKWTYDRLMNETIEVHGDKYDYSSINPADKILAKTKISIRCKLCSHEWTPTVTNHIHHKRGCPSCAGKAKWTYDKFMEKAKKIHGDKYDYSMIDPTSFVCKSTKIPLKCNICDYRWSPTIHNHIYDKSNCPNCVNRLNWTYEKFIKRALEIHANKYDYSQINPEDITNLTSRLNIKCNICMYEWNTPLSSHINHKRGCPNCAGNAKWTTDRLLEVVTEIHGDKYDYSEVVNVEIENETTRIPITCNTCFHKWETTIANHVNNKSGCPSCSGKLPWTLERFVDAAKKIHKDMYNYDKITAEHIVDSQSRIPVVCNKCKLEWTVVLNSHINSKTGCPHCRSSKGEIACRRVLDDLNVNYQPQYIIEENRIRINKYKYDFYFVHNGNNYLLEYDGIQHFEYNDFFHKDVSTFEERKMIDVIKTKLAIDHGFKIIRIDYTKNKQELVQTEISRALELDKSTYFSDESMYEWIVSQL